MKAVWEVDPNLKISERISQPDVVWHDGAEDCFTVYGLYKEGVYHHTPPLYQRMPENVAKSVSEGVYSLYRNTAGGRIRFVTDSEYVALRCGYDLLCDMPHMPQTGSSGFDLYLTDDTGCHFVKSFVPPWNTAARAYGYESIIHLGSRKMRDLTIHFPLYNNVTLLNIGLQPDAVIEKDKGYALPDPVVYYGSSITQGGCASRPGNSYQGFVSRALNLDQVNLGFSGSGRGEPVMAAYIASLPMCAFVLDYDHNAPDADHLQRTHYPMYKAVREAHPDIPILCVSRPNYDFEPRAAMREVIRQTVSRAQSEGDTRIRFIDGETLFGTDRRDDCTVDGAHPNDLGFYRMAQGILPVLREMLAL